MNVEPEHVDQLVEMGFHPAQARKALVVTHNCGVELALGWLVGNPDSDDASPAEMQSFAGGRASHQSNKLTPSLLFNYHLMTVRLLQAVQSLLTAAAPLESL